MFSAIDGTWPPTCTCVLCIWRFPEIGDTPKSSILMEFSIVNHPFGGPPFMETTVCFQFSQSLCAVWCSALLQLWVIRPAQALIDFAYGIQNNSPLSFAKRLGQAWWKSGFSELTVFVGLLFSFWLISWCSNRSGRTFCGCFLRVSNLCFLRKCTTFPGTKWRNPQEMPHFWVGSCPPTASWRIDVSSAAWYKAGGLSDLAPGVLQHGAGESRKIPGFRSRIFGPTFFSMGIWAHLEKLNTDRHGEISFKAHLSISAFEEESVLNWMPKKMEMASKGWIYGCNLWWNLPVWLPAGQLFGITSTGEEVHTCKNGHSNGHGCGLRQYLRSTFGPGPGVIFVLQLSWEHRLKGFTVISYMF